MRINNFIFLHQKRKERKKNLQKIFITVHTISRPQTQSNVVNSKIFNNIYLHNKY
jgi:hypothetical protein